MLTQYVLRTFFHTIFPFIFGILLPKLFWPTVRKNCSSDREKLLKFEAEGREFAKILLPLEQFFQTKKGIFWIITKLLIYFLTNQQYKISHLKISWEISRFLKIFWILGREMWPLRYSIFQVDDFSRLKISW